MKCLQNKDFGDLPLKWLQYLHYGRFGQCIPSGGTSAWHSAKEFIANRLFKSIEELEELLNRLLNEGDLIIKWGRKLKGKGGAVNAI